MTAADTGSEAFKVGDASSYDPVTQEFDRFTRRLSQPLALRLVALARLRVGEKILDVGTGTGVVALEAARRVGPAGTVLGIDLSEGMLRTARENAAQAGLTNTEFRVMDAEALDLQDRAFDAVLSLFALLHFPDPLAALREMFRVLPPGGRLVLGVGSGPRLLSWDGILQGMRRVRTLWRQKRGRLLIAPGFLDTLVEQHLPPSGGPEQTALASCGTNRAALVPALVRQAGFAQVRTSWQGQVARAQTPEEFWQLQSTFSSFARKRLAGAAPEKVEGVRAEFFATCRAVQSRGGALVYPYAALFVVARRP